MYINQRYKYPCLWCKYKIAQYERSRSDVKQQSINKVKQLSIKKFMYTGILRDHSVLNLWLISVFSFFLDAHSKTGWKTIPYPGTAIPSILWDISIDFGLIKLKFAALRSHEHFMAGKDQFGKIKTSFFGFLLCIDKINFFLNKLGIT